MSDLRLSIADASVVVDPADGGRLVSVRVGQHELLARAGDGIVERGCFVMAPYAGRVREGRLRFDDTELHLPLTLPPHAAHGLVLDRPWTVVAEEHGDRPAAVLRCDLDERWPFGGSVEQTIRLSSDRLELRLEARAGDRPYPASLGWHPWFPRQLASGQSVEIALDAGAMLARDDAWITTDRRVSPPPPPPWDDAFVDVTWPVRLRWPGALRLAVHADTDVVVIFTHRAEAVCVEPQTARPDAFDPPAAVVRPGAPLVATTVWSWSADPGEG